MKKIELLYFEGCPSYKTALENLKAVLADEKIEAELQLINVDSPEKAEMLKFFGSPSIRVNGVDFEGKTGAYRYSCRIFTIDGQLSRVPTKKYIRERLLSNE